MLPLNCIPTTTTLETIQLALQLAAGQCAGDAGDSGGAATVSTTVAAQSVYLIFKLTTRIKTERMGENCETVNGKARHESSKNVRRVEARTSHGYAIPSCQRDRSDCELNSTSSGETIFSLLIFRR